MYSIKNKPLKTKISRKNDKAYLAVFSSVNDKVYNVYTYEIGKFY